MMEGEFRIGENTTCGYLQLWCLLGDETQIQYAIWVFYVVNCSNMSTDLPNQ